MVNFSNQEILKQFAQHVRLTASQIQAASQLLSEREASIAFCQQYAMGDACGLSLSQWGKIKQFMHDQQIMQALPESSHAADLLQIRRFLPFDIHLNQHISLPLQLKSYPVEDLIAFVRQLISAPESEPLALLQQSFKDADEAMLEQMKGVLLLMLAQTPDLLQSLRQSYYLNAQVELTSSTKLTEHHKALMNDWPKPAPLLKKLDPCLLLRFWGLKHGEHLQLKWHHPEGEKLALNMIADTLGWKNQDKVADKWLSEAIEWVWQTYLSKILYRDLLGIAYDAMVEQLLPVVELKWRQLLSMSPLGSKPLLLLYPHGRSGVMLLAVDAQGEVKNDAMVYPFAPDYDAEQTLATLAKMLIKYNIDDMVLVAKPETKKILSKTIKNLKARYLDLKLTTHLISGELTLALFQQPVKQPEVEHVLHFARFCQCPLAYFAAIPAKKWLSLSLQQLPQAELSNLWKDLLQNYLYRRGVNVNHANKESLLCLGLSNEMIDKLIANRPYTSRQQLMDVLALPAERFTSLVGMLRVTDGEHPLDVTAVLPEDYQFIESWLKNQGLNLKEVIANPGLMKADDERTRRIKNLLNLQFDKLKTLSDQDLSDLTKVKAGGHYQGIVTRVMSYGVFIDLGDGVEGLMHISNMGIQPLTDLSLVFQPGDVVVVEWAQYDKEQKRLSLKFPMPKQVMSQSAQAKPFVKKTKPVAEASKPQPVKSSAPQAPNAMQLAFAKLKK